MKVPPLRTKPLPLVLSSRVYKPLAMPTEKPEGVDVASRVTSHPIAWFVAPAIVAVNEPGFPEVVGLMALESAIPASAKYAND